MPRQPGYYEWDDPELHPGNKKEGGWHQTLFDADGKLKGNARFVPMEESELKPEVIHETVYVTSDARREELLDDEMREAIAWALAALVVKGAELAAPRVKAWWDKGAGSFRRVKRRSLRARSRPTTSENQDRVEEAQSSDLAQKDEGTSRAKMSTAEAQARMIAAAAARAFAEEQMRLVTGAEILGATDLDEVRAQLASIPEHEMEQLTGLLVRQPDLLTDDSLANLAASLQLQHLELEPVRKRGRGDGSKF